MANSIDFKTLDFAPMFVAFWVVELTVAIYRYINRAEKQSGYQRVFQFLFAHKTAVGVNQYTHG